MVSGEDMGSSAQVLDMCRSINGGFAFTTRKAMRSALMNDSHHVSQRRPWPPPSNSP
jgi:hypothetical protein